MFNDWQKIKLQENANEIPPGSMPRSIDVFLRNDACEKVKPGDRILFCGGLIVLPDVNTLIKPGLKVTLEKQHMAQQSESNLNGVSGLKSIGVKDLTYKMAFISESICKHEQV